MVYGNLSKAKKYSLYFIQCINIIKPYYLNNDIQGASEYIVKEATRRWLKVLNIVILGRRSN